MRLQLVGRLAQRIRSVRDVVHDDAGLPYESTSPMVMFYHVLPFDTLLLQCFLRYFQRFLGCLGL